MKAAISRVVGAAISSPLVRDVNRLAHRRSGAPVIDYFHQVDDPYSHLAVQMIRSLAESYGATVRPWLVPAPDQSAAPERQRLREYGVRDAGRIAPAFGLDFPEGARLPDPAASILAEQALTPALGAEDFADRAIAVGETLWVGGAVQSPADAGPADAAAAVSAGAAERRRRGHYLGAMFHFEGEWYWGVDRLGYLEARLAARGLDEAPSGTAPLMPRLDVRFDGADRPGRRPLIEVWFSFRSPYTWIAFPRIRRLAAHYGADLDLRFILPMVMRGLPVPRMKSLYIVRDTKREADSCGLAFGDMVDPVGAGSERALAVAHAAAPLGLEAEFSERALRAAWSQGVDLASDRGLYGVAKAAGLTAAQVDDALADDGWRAVAEDNRRALFDAGLWGAPTCRVNGGDAWWGQDRLWVVEEDLKRALWSD